MHHKQNYTVEKRSVNQFTNMSDDTVSNSIIICGSSFEFEAKLPLYICHIIIKFPYNARSDWLKQRPLSENKVQVNDIKLAFKFLLRNFDRFDPN